MVTAVIDPGGQGASLVLRPHAPLSRQGALLMFAVVDTPIVGIAVICGLLGTWYVLPFSLLVVAAVGTGLAVGYRRTQRREVVSIDGDSVAIDKGHARFEQHYEFQRGWAQVLLEQAGPGERFGHLFIRSHGRQVELGEFLDDAEKQLLAARLRRLMGPAR